MPDVGWTVDTTAPHLALPVPQTVDATSPAGAVVGCTATGTFDVSVRGAQEQLASLREDVSGSSVPIGTKPALPAQLDAAAADLGRGGDPCDELAAFDAHVQAQTGRNVTQEQADRWWPAARQVGAVAGCRVPPGGARLS